METNKSKYLILFLTAVIFLLSANVSFAAARPKIKISASYNKITIRYTKVKDAKKYKVWVKKNSGSWRKYKRTSKRKITYTAPDNGTYRFKVRAIRKKGKYLGRVSYSRRTKISFYKLSGKSVLIVGDSIQRAAYGAYVAKAVKTLGAKRIVNKSEGSTTYGIWPDDTNIPPNSIYSKIREMANKGTLKGYDYVILSAGTNDYGHPITKGRCPINPIDEDLIYTIDSCTVLTTAFNETLGLIKQELPNAKIIVFTPIGRYRGWEGKKAVSINCDTLENKWGYTLADYREAITEITRENGGIVISGTSCATNAEMSNLNNTKDWLHPRKTFAKKMTNRAVKHMLDVL